MTSARFELEADDGPRLVGVLVTPDSSPPYPAAVLLNGSGPLDRDSNMAGQVLSIASSLASSLAERGVASLRFDKRGVGESDGVFVETGFERETEDAAAALRALREVDDVDPSRVSVVGHSAGVTIAVRLASRSGVAGAVLLSAARSTGAQVMEAQSRRIAASYRGLRRLAAGRFLRSQERIREALLVSEGDVDRIDGHELPARWFREYMIYDPVPDLCALRCPVLAITGSSDLQVDPGDVGRIGELVSGPFTGLTPDGLTHVLRIHPGRASLHSYRKQLAKPVDAALLAAVADWVAAR